MPDPAPIAIHLTLLRHGDTISVDLAETSTIIRRGESHADDAFLRELAAEMSQAALHHVGDRASALARIGGLVSSHLLTDAARQRLRDVPAADLYLRLDERLLHVPWELCHDGTAFLATRMRIGRQVITTQPVPPGRAANAALDRLRVLLIGDPTESLPQAISEVERLCGFLDELPGIDVTLVAGHAVRRVPLLAMLQAHDIVHFAGHSHYDAEAPARSGWRLADGLVTGADVSRLQPPPRLVFSNSCEAADGAPWDGRFAGQVFGLGSAFLLAGVPNFVGPFWVVHDGESFEFATTCYRHLAAGGRLGDALQAARTAVAAAYGPTSITWASYVHYGDPAFRPFPRGVGPTTAPRAAPTETRREPARFDISLGNTAHAPVVGVATETIPLVGRAAELARLSAALDAARAGRMQVVFVSGPPGIGKTALLDTFLGRVRAAGHTSIAQGDAVEQYGAGEAYLPLLAALGRLGREPDGQCFVTALRQVGPSWGAQFPGLFERREHEALATASIGSSRERMLRELAEMFEVATTSRPLVLVLEDLHWSDRSTIEAIAYVARSRAPTRLLLIGTYRSTEMMRAEHPLRAVTQELRANRRAEELRLSPLDAAAVAAYLRERLGAADVDAPVTELVHARTDGHPLFLVNVVDFAVREALVRTESGRLALTGTPDRLRSGIPEGLRPMIERQIESLPAPEQRTLEAAAVAGAEFSIAAVAAALEAEPNEIDDRCEGLAWRGHFLRANGLERWPDGTLAGRYAFVHALYRNVLSDRLAPTRRARLHRRIAERKAEAWGAADEEIAGELASHFEAGGDAPRAIGYRIHAGDVAMRRHADGEATAHFRHAQALLPQLRDTDERAQREFEVLVKLAAPLMATAGYAASAVEAIFERAHALSRSVPAGVYHAPLMRGLVSFHQVRGRNQVARLIGEELLATCERGNDPIARVQAHYGHGVTLFNACEFDGAIEHLSAGLSGYDPATHATHVSVYGGYDPGVACQSWLGWARWNQGQLDRAVNVARAAVTLAERLAHPFSLAFACSSLALVYLQRGEPDAAAPLLDRSTSICEADGFLYQGAITLGLTGWVRLYAGHVATAVAAIEESIALQQGTDANASMPGFYNLLARAYLASADPVAASAATNTGLAAAQRTGQQFDVASLYLTQARAIVAGGGDPVDAEASLQHALDFATRSKVPAFALTAATGVAEHLLATDRADEVRDLLGPIVAQFTEGEDTAPLRAARAALAAAARG